VPSVTSFATTTSIAYFAISGAPNMQMFATAIATMAPE